MTSRRRNRGSARRGHLRSLNTRQQANNHADLVVDLTCEDNHDSDQYVDLTSVDTSTIEILDTPTTDVGPLGIHDDDSMYAAPPLLLSDSDSESELPPVPFSVTRRPTLSTITTTTTATTPTGVAAAVVCPVCFDGLSEIKSAGRHVMATTCGHVFCSECIGGILTKRDGGASRCPTCRKKLTARTVHQLFI